MSVWYKRRTGTNVGLVQTSDWYKRRTGTNVGQRKQTLFELEDFFYEKVISFY